MPYEHATFPLGVWDGLSANTHRLSRNDTASPDARDWDKIVAEMIAVQRFAFDLTLGSSVYQAIAAEDIQQGQFVHRNENGHLILAASNQPYVAGMATENIAAGNLGTYIRRGQITADDWSAVAGAAELEAADYFLTSGGQMSTVAPETGFVIKVGRPQSPTIFDLDISQVVRL